MQIKTKMVVLLFLGIVSFCKIGFCEDGFFEASAEEKQSVLCQLAKEGASAGRITFNFNPPTQDLGFIEYNGLFLDNNKKYYAIIHKITLTKLYGDANIGYTFEGIDETIGGGVVRGTCKNPKDFEVSGYFAASYSKIDCIYYRLTPLKSDWAKKITKENPKFYF